MPQRLESGIIFFRAKTGAYLSLACGALLVAFAYVVLTREGIFGVPFARSLQMMATYSALPFGAVLFLANVKRALMMGPTLTADDQAIDILCTKKPVGPIAWSEINGFVPVRHQMQTHLGIMLDDPERVLRPYIEFVSPLIPDYGPKTVHLVIPGDMIDMPVRKAVRELEEMRRAYSWRAR